MSLFRRNPPRRRSDDDVLNALAGAALMAGDNIPLTEADEHELHAALVEARQRGWL